MAERVSISPTSIAQDGPGIDLHNYAEAGIAVEMSDPDRDRAYARNMVTLTFDLSAFENVRLAFSAREFGEEPHLPKDEGGRMKDEEGEDAGKLAFGPVLDFDFDGVAVSADGVDWFEVRGLRDLSSRLAEIEIDLDAAILEAGLVYGPEFRVRLCQYDNKPRLMDGIALSGIALSGEAWAGPEDPALAVHLKMDDNAPNPLVRDAARLHPQTFLDAGGDPATAAHSVAGAGPGTGAALAFDGVDDAIDCGTDLDSVLGAGSDFTVAVWWRAPVGVAPGAPAVFVGNWGYSWTLPGVGLTMQPDGTIQASTNVVWDSTSHPVFQNWAASNDGVWHHYAITRAGTTVAIYRDGGLALSDTQAENALSMVQYAWRFQYGKVAGEADDFRMYSRALSEPEIQALFAMGS